MPVEKYIQDAIILLATIDPIGTLLVFVAITAGRPPSEKNRIALRAVLFAGAILLASIVVGQILLAAMGVTMIAFQVSGGIILFIFGLKLVFGDLLRDASTATAEGDDIAVFPLAIPTIATPGAILAAIILTDNHLFPPLIQAGTAAITVAILALTYVALRFSSALLRLTGRQGAALLARIMGLILCALSIQLILDAFVAAQLLT
jgi:multiple antibiotic resistance protein